MENEGAGVWRNGSVEVRKYRGVGVWGYEDREIYSHTLSYSHTPTLPPPKIT